VTHTVNQGYGAAVWSGLTSATGEKRCYTDADGQFRLDEVRLLLAEMPPADFVSGYRNPRRDTLSRRWMGWGWTQLNNLLFGYIARDVDCGFKLMRAEVVESCPVQSRGAMFSAEMHIRARRAGFTYREVPLTHLPRTKGASSGGRLDVVLRGFRELLRVWLQLRTHPQQRVRS
jgi:glycosyltransferase involved in cell wall biosynthesis